MTFFIWDEPLDLLQQFLAKLSENSFNLTFMHAYSYFEIPFLDTLVRIDAKGTISTTLFRKTTAGNSILQATSAHPVPLKRSIPFAQYLHLGRICSTVNDYNMQANLLQRRLLERGYSRT